MNVQPDQIYKTLLVNRQCHVATGHVAICNPQRVCSYHPIGEQSVRPGPDAGFNATAPGGGRPRPGPFRKPSPPPKKRMQTGRNLSEGIAGERNLAPRTREPGGGSFFQPSLPPSRVECFEFDNHQSASICSDPKASFYSSVSVEAT